MLVRTWNVFHGNAHPPERQGFLAETIRLAAADRPDVLCLQEVPVWALDRLGEWSGMSAAGAVAARPTIGPLPSTAELGRVLTSLHHGLARSAFAGQANAVLVGGGLRIAGEETLTLNPRRFRRAQARWLGLDLVARLAWAKERRVCQAVRVAAEGGATLVVVLGRERGRVGEDDVHGPKRRLAPLLVRTWNLFHGNATPPERRRLDGRLLSDHAPVEVRVG